MAIDQKILDRVNNLEAFGLSMVKEATMLKKELLAGGQPVAPRKGKKHNPDITVLASANYNKKKARRHLNTTK